MKSTVKKRNHLLFLAYAAIIAALYVVMTHLAALFGLASGVIQVRISEALVILCLFTPAAVPGMVLGCFIANLTTMCLPLDILVGTSATLIGALGALVLKRIPYLAPLPTVFANAFMVPIALIWAYGAEGGYWYFVLTVGIGEVISAWVLGIALYFPLRYLKIWNK